MAGGLTPPPRWTPEELEKDSEAAIEAVIASWMGSERYVELYHELRPAVRDLFSETGDLRNLSGSALESRPDMVEWLRYVSAPVLSADDLSTLARSSLTPRNLVGPPAGRVAQVLLENIDPIRCPWIAADRAATVAERRVAIKWTTGVLAANRASTERRVKPAQDQERATADVLLAAGYTEVGAPKRIVMIDALERGQFTRETRVGEAKCDLPVRLRDGRLLCLECKVSNSALNSVKRLNREVGGKADDWARRFGTMAVTGAVLAGVFKLTSLLEAQERGVAVFWQHDLSRLHDFVSAAG